jgi:hypothetical protein
MERSNARGHTRTKCNPGPGPRFGAAEQDSRGRTVREHAWLPWWQVGCGRFTASQGTARQGEERGGRCRLQAKMASGSTTTCLQGPTQRRRRMQAALGESAVVQVAASASASEGSRSRPCAEWVPANVSPLLRDKQRLSAVSTSVAEGVRVRVKMRWRWREESEDGTRDRDG